MEEVKSQSRRRNKFEFQKFHIRLPLDVHEELQMISENLGISMNAIIVLALKDYFEKVTKKETK